MPGFGKVTAATLASRLAGHTFGHSDQFVAYCGLDVGVRQSGKKNGQTGLTRQGDGELRRLLYLAAQSNLRSKNSPFKAQYEKERSKQGLVQHSRIMCRGSKTGPVSVVAAQTLHALRSQPRPSAKSEAKPLTSTIESTAPFVVPPHSASGGG